MTVITIRHQPNSDTIFIAAAEIPNLAVVEISPAGSQYVAIGTNTTPERAVGVANGPISGSTSGKPIQIITMGIVSGVVCASSINAGDRVQVVSGGRIAAYNALAPTASLSGIINMNLQSGGILSGGVSIGVGNLVNASGIISGLNAGLYLNSGQLLTAKVVGKALASGGGAGSGIPIFVSIGG